MDLYVERQCVDQMKAGDVKKFLLLFDACFSDLYKYVVRRVGVGVEAEKIVRLAVLDALGQIQNTPADIGYLVWLYGLAKPRVWEFMGKASMPRKTGLISVDKTAKVDKEDLLKKAERMLGKLSLEEREILRLKFFEEVADGDVMTILGVEEKTIGPKIYRVLKRAHFLLFGESDDRQGVYFGELSGFLARIREAEEVSIPQVFKLNLRADISGRIDRRELAIDVGFVEETRPKKKASFIPKERATGSNDPAKIFVEAVKEMREEEEVERLKEERKVERQEKVFDFIDRWKYVLTFVPAVVFVGVVTFVVISFVDFSEKVKRDRPIACDVEVDFEGDFSGPEKSSVNEGIGDRLCDYFDVERLLISRIKADKMKVDVDVPGWFLEYRFVKKPKGGSAEGVADWRIKQYERISDSDEKSGKVQRNPRSSAGDTV